MRTFWGNNWRIKLNFCLTWGLIWQRTLTCIMGIYKKGIGENIKWLCNITWWSYPHTKLSGMEKYVSERRAIYNTMGLRKKLRARNYCICRPGVILCGDCYQLNILNIINWTFPSTGFSVSTLLVFTSYLWSYNFSMNYQIYSSQMPMKKVWHDFFIHNTH